MTVILNWNVQIYVCVGEICVDEVCVLCCKLLTLITHFFLEIYRNSNSAATSALS
jgi:hypothetical protein